MPVWSEATAARTVLSGFKQSLQPGGSPFAAVEAEAARVVQKQPRPNLLPSRRLQPQGRNRGSSAKLEQIQPAAGYCSSVTVAAAAAGAAAAACSAVSKFLGMSQRDESIGIGVGRQIGIRGCDR